MSDDQLATLRTTVKNEHHGIVQRLADCESAMKQWPAEQAESDQALDACGVQRAPCALVARDSQAGVLAGNNPVNDALRAACDSERRAVKAEVMENTRKVRLRGRHVLRNRCT